MKLPHRWIGAAIVIALISPFGTSASDDVKVTVVITVAKQDASPVQIVGFKLPAQVAGVPAIVLRNTTAKEIRHVGVMNYLGNPRGAGGAEPKPYSSLTRKSDTSPLWRPLGPNTTAEFAEESLKSYSVGLWAHQLLSNCLHAAFYVTQVRFADGTVWRMDEHEPGEFEPVRARLLGAWKDSIRPESTKGCDDSPATQTALGRLDGTGWPPLGGDGVSWPAVERPSYTSTDVVPFFAFTCPIRNDVAFCRL